MANQQQQQQQQQPQQLNVEDDTQSLWKKRTTLKSRARMRDDNETRFGKGGPPGQLVLPPLLKRQLILISL